MTEDEIQTILDAHPTREKKEVELENLNKICSEGCGLPCSSCNECGVAGLKAVFEYCLYGRVG